jgi:hypothetical protein
MEYLRDDTRRLEVRQKSLALLSLAVVHNTTLVGDADETLRQRGAARYVKSGDMLAADDFGATPAPASAALAAMINAEDLAGRLAGAIRLPLAMPGRLQVGTTTAAEVAEGAVAPISVLTFNAATKPVKVEATIVVSNEALRAVDATTQNGILDLLVAACAAASDRAFVAALTAGTSTGTATPAALFAAIGNPQKPYLIAGLGDLLDLPAGSIRDLQAIGIGILSSPAAAGMLIAVDAAGVLISDGGVEVRTAKHATVMLDLTGGSPANPVPVSLWQSDLTAMGALRYVRISVRPGAVAFANVGSPS